MKFCTASKCLKALGRTTCHIPAVVLSVEESYFRFCLARCRRRRRSFCCSLAGEVIPSGSCRPPPPAQELSRCQNRGRQRDWGGREMSAPRPVALAAVIFLSILSSISPSLLMDTCRPGPAVNQAILGDYRRLLPA